MAKTLVGRTRHRPWIIAVFSVFFMVVPGLNIVGWIILGWIDQQPVDLARAIHFHLGTLGLGAWGTFHFLAQLVLWSGFVVAGFGIFKTQKWGFFLCLIVAGINRVFAMLEFPDPNSANATAAPTFDPLGQNALATMAIFVPIIIAIRKDLLAPFFNPRLKWWDQRPRIQCALAIIAHIDGRAHACTTFDISDSGMFLVFNELPSITLGSEFAVSIKLVDSGQILHAHCSVRWRNQGTEKRPAGLGVSFTNLDRRSKLRLNDYLQTQTLLDRKRVRSAAESSDALGAEAVEPEIVLKIPSR